MSFPAQNEAPPISVNNEFALSKGEETVVPTGQTAGVTQNNKVFPTANSVIVTVTDSAGNVIPITDVLVTLIRNGDVPAETTGLTINFSSAPIAEGQGVVLSELPAGTRGLFQRFFVQSLALQGSGSDGGSSLKVDDFVTYTESFANSNLALSQGSDATYTTVLNNVIYAEAGDDAVVVDAYVSNPGTKTKSYINLGAGNDVLEVTKAALKQNKSKLELLDFNKNDTLSLQTKAKKVDGIGTDKLKITTKKSTFTITSENGKFSKGNIDFI